MRTLRLLMCLMALIPALTIIVPAEQTGATCPNPGEVGVPQGDHCSYGTVNSSMSVKDFVCTRGGYRNGGYKFVVRDVYDNTLSGQEVWLYKDGSTAYLNQDTGFDVVCAGDTYPECSSITVVYSYVEGTTDGSGVVIFPERWGGYGSFEVYGRCFNCPSSVSIYGIATGGNEPKFKSTDMNGDGRWDQADLDLFDTMVGLTDATSLWRADFDLDSDVDASDRTIVSGDLDESSAPEATCYAPGASVDASVEWIGSTTASVVWGAATGATGYHVRWSKSPLNNGNFWSTTGHDTLTGTQYVVHGLTPSTMYYFGVEASYMGSMSNLGGTDYATTTSSQTRPGPDDPEGPPTTSTGGAVPSTVELVVAGSANGRGTATIEYGIPVGIMPAGCRLAIYDAGGRRVMDVPTDGSPGRHTARWDLRNERGSTAPGVYFVRLDAGALALARPIVVLGR